MNVKMHANNLLVASPMKYKRPLYLDLIKKFEYVSLKYVRMQMPCPILMLF